MAETRAIFIFDRREVRFRVTRRVRSAIIRLEGVGEYYKFRGQSRGAILAGLCSRARACARSASRVPTEGGMQNVSSRYRLKHKFLKRCDTYAAA